MESDNNLPNQQTIQPTTDKPDDSLLKSITNSSNFKENMALPVKKRISNKVLLLILMMFFMLMIVPIIVFIFFVNSNTLSEEQSFTEFVQKSLVQNEAPSSGWVSNSVNQDPNFQTLLSSIRGITQNGGYTRVSSYGECRTILNTQEYIDTKREKYCAVKLCKSNSVDCYYLVGYIRSSDGSRTKGGSITSFGIFETQSEVDNEVKTLLQD